MEIEDTWRSRYRIPLETDRFRLRPLTPGDEVWLTHIWADPDVNRYLWEPDLSPDQAAKAAKVMVDLDAFRHHFGIWAIEEKSTGARHGWVELSKLEPWWGPNDEIAISYVLQRQSWGRGIATEAAARLVRHAFEANRLELVMAVVVGENVASKRVVEKLGMHLVKTKRVSGRDLQYFRIDNPDPPRPDEQ